MRRKIFVFFIGLLLFSSLNAQKKDDILLSIGNTPVSISEFKRVYLKNIDLVKDDSQKDIDEYLELFISYKLKLKEAKALGLDQNKTYIKELEGYKKQLAANYLTDTKASDALIQEAYQRSLERVNASHILVMVKPNASPKDTLAAYQKILDAKSKIESGEDFEKVAKAYSQDPSAQKNGGNLGWFSVFRMVYPFESAAYNTNIGSISKPFKTQFGYHIVKVNQRQKTLGEVSIAHIMIAINDKRTSENAETRIKEVEQQLNQGSNFASLAKQYSDDPSTAVKGGEIRRFGQGALNSEEFENAAFTLKKKGEISKPIQTKYGWHILKLIEKYPPKKIEEVKASLTKQIKRDVRSKLITDSFINSLRVKYEISKNQEAITYFKSFISKDNMQSALRNTTEKQDKVFFKIKDKPYLYKDFSEFLISRIGESLGQKITASLIDKAYTDFESSSLLKYYEEHLEEDNQDFANIINEYRDGLLLFDLMESKIWNSSKADTTAIKKFYETNKEKYIKDETYKILKVSSSRIEVIDSIKNMFENNKTVDQIKKEVNTNDTVLAIFSEEELTKGTDKLPKGFSAKKSKTLVIEEDNLNTLIMIKEILPSRTKTFEEVKGEIINDFQEQKEDIWISKLKEKYPVKVNKKVMKKVKKELSK